MAQLQQVHIDAALSNVSVAYRNNAFVAERVFPVVQVQKESDYFYRFSKQHFHTYNTNIRPGSSANEIPVDIDQKGYYKCDGHALEVAIPDEARANADPGAQIDIEYTEKVTSSVLLRQELDLEAQLYNTANYAGSNFTTLSGTSQWSDYTNSNPFTAIENAKLVVQQQIGRQPNTLFLPKPTYLTIRNHPAVLDRIKYTNGGVHEMMDPKELALAFDVNEVIVPEDLFQSSAPGAADSLSFVWGKNALLFYKPERPGLREVSFGYHFLWIGNGVSYLVKRYRREDRDADIIKVKKYYAQQFIDPNAGFLWVNATA